MGDTFDQAIWPGAQSSTIHSTAWLFRNLSSRLWGLNWYLHEITNKSFPNNRDPPYKNPCAKASLFICLSVSQGGRGLWKKEGLNTAQTGILGPALGSDTSLL